MIRITKWFHKVKFHWPFACIFLIFLSVSYIVRGQTSMEKVFLDPPESAKPRGYWIWSHGNFDYATIREELQEFKAKGLGGVDIFDFGVSDRLDIIPAGPSFLSDEQLDGIAFALREAKKLDLSIGFSVSNGWNAGGDWTTPDEMSMQLLIWQDTLEGPVDLRAVGFPDIPMYFTKPYGQYKLDPPVDDQGFPEWYENVSLQAFPLGENGIIADTADVISFDQDAIDKEMADIRIPPGKWIIIRSVVAPIGQHMWMQSENTEGYIMDHFSKKATRHHFNYVIGELESRLGGLGESALERLYVCSFESEAPVEWSPELPQEFLEMNGYPINQFISVLAGHTVISREVSDRFLYDYRKTVSEMFINNHYRQASRICRDHGLLLASESGGPGPPLHDIPSEDLKALGAVDIMRGEFWNRHERLDEDGVDMMQVVKNIASAAHIYGHKVVEMEAFTSFNKHWQETPLELKALADRAFCEGMTRVVYHTMPHSPPEAGMPGWSYQAGTHIHPKMTWWPMSDDFHAYLARCSAMLMEGDFVADVVYYYGHDIPNFARPKHIRPGLGAGYDYDDLNTEVLLQIEKVEDGKIVLPSGMKYAVMVLPEDERMDLKVLRKIEELLLKGAAIIGPKPSRVYGLSNFRQEEEALRLLADRIWGKQDQVRRLDKRYGSGRIITGITPREVLMEMGRGPDLMYRTYPEGVSLDFIHRTGLEGEIYFVRNTDSTAAFTEITCRVKGLAPEIWDPVAGTMEKPALYREAGEGILLPVYFEPLESKFIIFRKPVKKKNQVTRLSIDGVQVFPAGQPASIRVDLSFTGDGLIRLNPYSTGQYFCTLSDGEENSILVDSPWNKISIEGPWDVRFLYGWGAEPVQVFEKLKDWSLSADPGMKYFSGKGTYRVPFRLEKVPAPDAQAVLDLGKVGAVARVYLNGWEVGSSLLPPHKLVVGDYLKEGENYLVVEVANTWLNRMIGDLEMPLNEQFTRSNVAHGTDPANRPWSGYQLQSSGLIGPVSLEIRKLYFLEVEQ